MKNTLLIQDGRRVAGSSIHLLPDPAGLAAKSKNDQSKIQWTVGHSMYEWVDMQTREQRVCMGVQEPAHLQGTQE